MPKIGRSLFAFALAASLGAGAGAARGEFRAGASRVDATPTKFPVLVNGGFLQAKADRAVTPILAKGLALDDGSTRLVFVVVDSCMMPRELIDKAKAAARDKTGVPTERILVSATHTHTAPAAMGALGCPADPGYVEFLPGKIVEAVEKAVANLAPAEVGWGVVDVPEHTHTRRWIRKPDKLVVDPFGGATGRAHMHPGHLNPDAIAPSGPSDTALTLLSVRTPAGKPIAILANYSMHYFGAGPLSADYYGRFGEALRQLVGGDASFVGIMSQGTSGDQQWMNYGAPRPELSLEVYADAVAARAHQAYAKIKHRPEAKLASAQTTLRLRRRVPDAARLAWARPIVAAMGDRAPRNQPEVYAKEAVYLNEEPERELILQSIRVGDLAVNAIPNEVYAITGLKLKARSPFPVTMNIELANGAEGYIPPPEQHALGGYTTWPARTAALEVEAEPKIVAALAELYPKLGSPAAPAVPRRIGPHPATHFYPLEDMEGGRAQDYGKNPAPGRYEGLRALYLDAQAASAGRPEPGAGNHFAYFAGGRLVVPGPKRSTWAAGVRFWCGIAPAERAAAWTILAGDNGETLSVGGSAANAGRLVLRTVDGKTFVGRTAVKPKTWYDLRIVRNGRSFEIKLDDAAEMAGETGRGEPPAEFGFGGSSDPATRFEGMLDSITLLYDES